MANGIKRNEDGTFTVSEAWLIFDGGMASHWIGNYGAVKDFDEMVEFLTDELQGEFKITQF